MRLKYGGRQETVFDESARGGASTRRELFSDTYRKEVLANLASLRNKTEENEDVPMSEDTSMF